MRQTMATAVFSTIQRRCSVWGLRFGRTIRGRILIALLVMSMITAALGVHAAIGISGVGALVSKTFDGSLMSINYARAAAADFASMQAAFARRWVVSDSEMRAKLDESVDSWARSLTDDLEIAAQTIAVQTRSPGCRECPACGQELEHRALAPDRRNRTQR